VSIYSPYDLSAARINGQPAAMEPGRELGLNAYSTFVDIPAGGTVTIELDVAGTWTEDTYGVDVPPEPMARPDLVEVNLTVAGEAPVSARGAGTQLEGGRVRWTGPLARLVHVEARLR
jgi:hypothetical protein